MSASGGKTDIDQRLAYQSRFTSTRPSVTATSLTLVENQAHHHCGYLCPVCPKADLTRRRSPSGEGCSSSRPEPSRVNFGRVSNCAPPKAAAMSAACVGAFQPRHLQITRGGWCLPSRTSHSPLSSAERLRQNESVFKLCCETRELGGSATMVRVGFVRKRTATNRWFVKLHRQGQIGWPRCRVN